MKFWVTLARTNPGGSLSVHEIDHKIEGANTVNPQSMTESEVEERFGKKYERPVL